MPGGVKALSQPSGWIPFANAACCDILFLSWVLQFPNSKAGIALVSHGVSQPDRSFPGFVHFERAAIPCAAVLPRQPVTGHSAWDLSEMENVCREEWMYVPVRVMKWDVIFGVTFYIAVCTSVPFGIKHPLYKCSGLTTFPTTAWYCSVLHSFWMHDLCRMRLT